MRLIYTAFLRSFIVLPATQRRIYDLYNNICLVLDLGHRPLFDSHFMWALENHCFHRFFCHCISALFLLFTSLMQMILLVLTALSRFAKPSPYSSVLARTSMRSCPAIPTPPFLLIPFWPRKIIRQTEICWTSTLHLGTRMEATEVAFHIDLRYLALRGAHLSFAWLSPTFYKRAHLLLFEIPLHLV